MAILLRIDGQQVNVRISIIEDASNIEVFVLSHLDSPCMYGLVFGKVNRCGFAFVINDIDHPEQKVLLGNERGS